jgi:hypothetical protein
LTIIKLILVPLNVTSQVQPLEQSIFAATKGHFWQHLVAFLLEVANDPKNAGKSLKLLRPLFYQMMCWVHAAWADDITTSKIFKCWRKAGILPEHWLRALPASAAAAKQGVPMAGDGAAAAAAPPSEKFQEGLLNDLETEHRAGPQRAAPADEELPQAAALEQLASALEQLARALVTLG